MNTGLVFAQNIGERVEFEMAVLKQRKIDGERRVFQDEETHQYFFIAHKRNSCGVSLFGNIIEYRTVNRWNSLTEEVVSAPSLNSFKSRLDELWRGYSHAQDDCFPVRTHREDQLYF